MTPKEKWHKARQVIQRRRNQVIRVVELKIDQSHLSIHQRATIERWFLEGKWLWNWVIADIPKRLTSDAWKTREVEVKVGGHFETRSITLLPAQCKKAVLLRIRHAMKTLQAAKSKGHRVGALKFKRTLWSIPLPQNGYSHRIIGRNKVRLVGLGKKPLRVRGMSQLSDGAEIGQAMLVRKASGYYLRLWTYIDHGRVPNKPKLRNSVGMDLGIKTQVTLSNGLKIEWEVPETPRLKKLQRALVRSQKGSRRRSRLTSKIRREYEYIANVRKDIACRVIGLLKQYGVVAYQKDRIANWKRRWGRRVHHAAAGEILSRLARLDTAVPVERFVPTSKTCYACGHVLSETIPLDVRQWTCPFCGAEHDRDVNAARVIEMLGLASRQMGPPCGAQGATPVEWEAIHRILGPNPRIRWSLLQRSGKPSDSPTVAHIRLHQEAMHFIHSRDVIGQVPPALRHLAEQESEAEPFVEGLEEDG